VALRRAPSAGRYGIADIERFRHLQEHLKRALTVGTKVGSLTSLQRLGEDLLDRSSAAVFLLDSAGRVVFTNRAAEVLQAHEDGLRVSTEGLRLGVAPEDEQLQALIGQAAIASRRATSAPAGVMSASRPSGRRPYGVWVVALARVPSALALFRPAVCVLISDPERRLCPSPQHLRTLFNMTEAEARLTVHLADVSLCGARPSSWASLTVRPAAVSRRCSGRRTHAARAS
jgi:hypothetical protein